MKAKFPGVRACLSMLARHDPQMQEDGFHWLLPHVDEYLDALITAFNNPENEAIQSWLLELIGHSQMVAAVELLSEQLHSDHRALRT